MAQGIEPKPFGVSFSFFSYNNQIKDGWIRKCVCGNVVQITGNIAMSDSFPISWTDTLIATDVPKSSTDQFCGIVRFDNTAIPPATVAIKSDGLYISSRNNDIKGQVGILIATYITTD